MDNNFPISIFQSNSNDMQVNNDEIDEDEEKADQIRRNIELAKDLDKYLEIDDDIVDQLETSANDSEYGCGDKPKYENELCRLRNELILKNNEVETLKQLLNNERLEKSAIQNDCEKKLKIFEAEKERAIMTKNQTHDLLVESKTELSNFQNYMEDLKQKLDSAENNNSKLLIELQQTKTMLTDLQHQHHNYELDIRHKNNSRIDSSIKQLQDKHNAQIEIMQQQIDSLSFKLSDKEDEVKRMTFHFKELERSREALLFEKSEVMSQLANALDDQQKLLLSNKSLSEENSTLYQKTISLAKQNDELEKCVSNLKKKLESKKIGNFSVECQGNLNLQNEKVNNQSVDTLNNELKRSLEDQQILRDEVKKLKNEIANKNEELQKLRITENQALIAANEDKEMQHRLMTRVKNLENELNERKSEQSSGSKSPVDNKFSLQKELTSVLEDREKIKNMYIKICDEKQDLIKELQILQNVKQCIKCLELKKEFEEELSKKQIDANDHLKQIEVLKQELADSKAVVDSLNNKLTLQEHQTNLINELKSKAAQFEQFMKASRESSPKEKIGNEMKIMEDMARRYAVELKSVERSYNDQLRLLKDALNEMKMHLHVKTEEIESLKSIIMRERTEMQKIVSMNEETARNVLDKQTEILKKCRLELKSYKDKMEALVQELNKKTDLVTDERESIVLLQNQIVDMKTAFLKRETDLLAKIDSTKKDSLHLKEKYQSAKKIAQQYKTYSEEKEKHMVQEYIRLKEGYKEAVEKMEKRLSHIISNNEEKYNQKLHDVKMEYLEKLKLLKTDVEVSSTTEFVQKNIN